MTRLLATASSATRVSRISAATSNAASCGKACVADERPVLLIDEIGKADIEFPNDHRELDRMEMSSTKRAKRYEQRPIVVITSNNEEDCRTPFCAAASSITSGFPMPVRCAPSSKCIFPGIKHRLVAEALRLFCEIRDVPRMKKKPSTSGSARLAEALDGRGRVSRDATERDPKKLVPPLHGALIKDEQDVHLFEAARLHDKARLAVRTRALLVQRLHRRDFPVGGDGNQVACLRPAWPRVRRLPRPHPRARFRSPLAVAQCPGRVGL